LRAGVSPWPNTRFQRTRSRSPLKRSPLGGPAARYILTTWVVFLLAGALVAQNRMEADKAVAAFEAAHPGVEKVGGDVGPAKLARHVNPSFPEKPRRLLGPIMLIAVVSKTGHVVDPTVVISADPELDRCVLIAVRKWEYKPARKHGKAVDSFLTITVTLDPAPA
jgi:TonB family protein